MPSQKSALITGANGYIGNAVARAFSIAGYRTYGLVRSLKITSSLAATEIFPIIGSAADLSFLPTLHAHAKTFDVIVSATEDVSDYVTHFNDVIRLLQKLAKTSNENGVRPLVIFTSGCKDYGMTAFHASPDLSPHTELSPLNPPSFLQPRAENAAKVFEHSDLFDAVLTRPTTLYGFGSSYYATFFEAAYKASTIAAQGGESVLRLPADEDSIVHATHISDLAAAYLAIANAPRDTTSGQVYNISSHRYETLRELGEALTKEYGIEKVEFTPGARFAEGEFLGDLLMTGSGFTQWVESQKLRRDTGWTDVRALFTEDVGLYRGSYEVIKDGDEGVQRILGYSKK